MRPIIYKDKEGNYITGLECEKLLSDPNYTVIKNNEHAQYVISTVWLGLNHLPLDSYFETMIFCDDENDPLHNFIKRYETCKEAEIGHDAILKKVQDGLIFLEPIDGD